MSECGTCIVHIYILHIKLEVYKRKTVNSRYIVNILSHNVQNRYRTLKKQVQVLDAYHLRM